MATIHVRTNFPEIAAKLDALPQDVGEKALVRAMNRTIDQGRLEMARAISREYMLTVGKVKERLAVRKAYVKGTSLRFQAELLAKRKTKGRSMNLIHFVERYVTLAEHRRRQKKGTAGQLHFRIKRKGGAKVIPGAFIANYGRTVFIREPNARWNPATRSTLPIRPLSTIDIPQMFNARRINTLVRDVMMRRLPVNFKRELRAVLGGWIKKT